MQPGYPQGDDIITTSEVPYEAPDRCPPFRLKAR